MLHKSSWRNSPWRNRDTYKGYNHILRTAKIWRSHTSYIHNSERTPTRDNYCSSLLPTPTQLKRGTICNILSNTRIEIHSRWRLKQQAHPMGLTVKNNERQRTIQGAPRKKKLLLSIYRFPTILAHGCKQNPEFPGLLYNQRNNYNIRRYSRQLRPHLGSYSNNSNHQYIHHSPTTTTSTAQLINKLRNLRQLVRDKANLAINLKER
jgi:hypothetical protein